MFNDIILRVNDLVLSIVSFFEYFVFFTFFYLEYNQRIPKHLQKYHLSPI